MDGIHDLGGMRGFGAVAKEVDEPTFHERWEAVALALNFLAISVLRNNNTDEYRHAVERMPPRHYLTASYYERMLTGVAMLLVEKGVISRDELDSRLGAPFALAGPVADGSGAEGRVSAAARFAVGDSVIVRDRQGGGSSLGRPRLSKAPSRRRYCCLR